MKKAKVSFSYDPSLIKNKELFEEYLSLLKEEGIKIDSIVYQDSELVDSVNYILTTGEKTKAIFVRPFTVLDEAIKLVNDKLEELGNSQVATENTLKIEWVADTQKENTYKEISADTDEVSYPVLVYRVK